MLRKPTSLAVVLAFVALTVGWFVIVFSASQTKPFGGSYHVRALVDSAAGLGAGASVTVAGLRVGRVDSVERAGQRAVLDLRLDDSAAPLPVDTRFGVRLRTVVGENYVELQPGRSQKMLPDGGQLPASRATQYVDLNDILDTLRGRTKVDARETIRSLGEGLRGQGENLNRTLEGAFGLIEDSTPVTTTLAHDTTQIARLTDEFGHIMATVGQRGQSVRDLATGLDQTFTAVASRDADLGRSLELFPATLAQVRTTTELLRSITRTSTPVLSQTADAVRGLGPAIGLLGPVAHEGRTLMAELGRTAPKLSDTLDRVPAVATPAAAALPQVKRVLCQLEPAAAYLKPYHREVTSVLQNMGYATNFYDATGHAARLFVSVGEHSAQFLDEPTAQTLSALLSSGILGKLGNVGYSPLPPPGGGGETVSASTAPTVATVKQPYPHVTAAC